MKATALATSAGANDSPQFRGPDRDGVYPASGLATQWPKAGPPLKWAAKGLGESYASVTVAGGKIFTTGKFGNEGKVV